MKDKLAIWGLIVILLAALIGGVVLFAAAFLNNSSSNPPAVVRPTVSLTATLPPAPTPRLTATPTPTNSPGPVITAISSMTPAQDQTIIITGSGFGTQAPYTDADSNFLRIHDEDYAMDAGWNGCSTCRQPDLVGVSISLWTNTQIVITGFGRDYGGTNTFMAGDKVTFYVWNPQSFAGPAQMTITVAG